MLFIFTLVTMIMKLPQNVVSSWDEWSGVLVLSTQLFLLWLLQRRTRCRKPRLKPTTFWGIWHWTSTTEKPWESVLLCPCFSASASIWYCCCSPFPSWLGTPLFQVKQWKQFREPFCQCKHLLIILRSWVEEKETRGDQWHRSSPILSLTPHHQNKAVLRNRHCSVSTDSEYPQM